eukprot:TRINITY_DN4810_c0_g1_i1.p1 TRINITY_DN4810_c0_g1~~TRINITY_DN4810_c0_g1_i1.p1  ORF type:complete len:518 (+),score=156.36 TRINITY_DN4810_c0_g1_i1:42-1595(+)
MDIEKDRVDLQTVSPALSIPENEHPYSNLRKFTICGLSFLTPAGAAISPSLPAIQNYFSAVSNVEVLTPLILTLPSLAQVFFAFFNGFIVDKFSKRKILLITLIMNLFVGILPFFLENFSLILIARFCYGITGSLIQTTVNTLPSIYYKDPKERNALLAFNGTSLAMGVVFFAGFGGFFCDQFGWRSPFLLLLISIFFIPLVYLCIYDHRSYAEEELNRKMQTGDSKKQSKKFPIVSLLSVYFTAAFWNTAFYLIPSFGSGKIQSIGGSASTFGVIMILDGIANFIFTFIFRKFCLDVKFAYAGTVASASYFVSCFAMAKFTSIAELMCILPLFIGIANGMGFPLQLRGVSDLVSDSHVQYLGRCMGILNMFVYAGQFLSPLIYGLPSLAPFGYDRYAYLASIECFLAIIMSILYSCYKPENETSDIDVTKTIELENNVEVPEYVHVDDDEIMIEEAGMDDDIDVDGSVKEEEFEANISLLDDESNDSPVIDEKSNDDSPMDNFEVAVDEELEVEIH